MRNQPLSRAQGCHSQNSRRNRVPIVGAPRQVTSPRYRCGIVRDPGRLTIVTAGLGTSALPIRIGAPPDVWLVRVGP